MLVVSSSRRYTHPCLQAWCFTNRVKRHPDGLLFYPPSETASGFTLFHQASETASRFTLLHQASETASRFTLFNQASETCRSIYSVPELQCFVNRVRLQQLQSYGIVFIVGMTRYCRIWILHFTSIQGVPVVRNKSIFIVFYRRNRSRLNVKYFCAAFFSVWS